MLIDKLYFLNIIVFKITTRVLIYMYYETSTNINYFYHFFHQQNFFPVIHVQGKEMQIQKTIT